MPDTGLPGETVNVRFCPKNIGFCAATRMHTLVARRAKMDFINEPESEELSREDQSAIRRCLIITGTLAAQVSEVEPCGADADE